MAPCAMLSLQLELQQRRSQAAKMSDPPRDDASDGTVAQPKPIERDTVKEIVMEVLSSLREAGSSKVPTDGATSGKETEKRGKWEQTNRSLLVLLRI